MFRTSGFALEMRTDIFVSAIWRAPLPLDLKMGGRSAVMQQRFCAAAIFHAAIQQSPKKLANCRGEIEGSAVKEGIRRKNHIATGRCDGGFKLQRTFFFLRSARHIGPDTRKILTV